MSLKEDIAKRLKEARANANLSGKEAAKKLKIAPSTLSQYETGKYQPTFDMAIEMAKIYGANIDYILTGEYSPEKENRDLNQEEASLIESFRKLDDFTKGKIIGIIETSIKKGASE